MSAPLFSKGPWHSEAWSDGQTTSIGNESEIVCYVHGYTDHPGNMANAAFIAAAPDMHEALRKAERFMSYFSGETSGTFVGPGMPNECLAQIRAVLSRAEGRTP